MMNETDRSVAEFTRCTFEDFEADFHGQAAFSLLAELRLVDSHLADADGAAAAAGTMVDFGISPECVSGCGPGSFGICTEVCELGVVTLTLTPTATLIRLTPTPTPTSTPGRQVLLVRHRCLQPLPNRYLQGRSGCRGGVTVPAVPRGDVQRRRGHGRVRHVPRRFVRHRRCERHVRDRHELGRKGLRRLPGRTGGD